MAKDNPHLGSTFEDFLKEEGLLEQVTASALKRVRSMKRIGKREAKPLDGRVGASSAAAPRRAKPGHDEVG